MPSVVSRIREPKPTNRTAELTFLVVLERVCAPFRRSPARAPRQAVLRASFWLVPWMLISTEPCGLPEEETKTRDASDRRLPPERLTWTRTSCVPGSLPRLSPRGYPARSLASKDVPGREAFHDASDASVDRASSRTAMCLQSHRSLASLRGIERGLVRPTARASDRTSDTPVASSSSAGVRGSPSRNLRPRPLRA